MRTWADIVALLDQLDHQTADSLEDQELDFKAWGFRSMRDGVALAIEMAVCMANGGGGTVVFGVDDKAIGRDAAILGVPPELDANLLKKAVYDSTDPKITPVFHELVVPEGTGRLLLMQIYPGLPPYTDTKGRAKIRLGSDCLPLTGTMRQGIMVETGETDYTAVKVDGPVEPLISSVAMERLREAARRERAPEDLLHQPDQDLLGALGLIRDGQLLRAGVFLAGTSGAIQEHFPGYVWTHLRMAGDTSYSDRADGYDTIPGALERIMDRVMANNPITTVAEGLFHFEIRTYPEIALREALLNAFIHADYRIPGPIMIKQHAHSIEISNPGGLPGGIRPENILRHGPISRNPLLTNALTRLRLVNRSNLGVRRMYHALLIEGKEPPLIVDEGEAVRVTMFARELSVPFRLFVAKEADKGRLFNVEHLLVLQHLLRHPEIDTSTAAEITQQAERQIREVLSEMELDRGYLERGGTGRGTYWSLRPDLHRELAAAGHPERDRRIDWEVAKTRVLSVLKGRADREDAGLTNAEVREIIFYDRDQVKRLLNELRSEGLVVLSGHGRGARWSFRTG